MQPTLVPQIDSMIVLIVIAAFIISATLRPPREYWAKCTIFISSLAGCLGIYTLVNMGENSISETTSARLITLCFLMASFAGWLSRSKHDDDFGRGDDGGDDDDGDGLDPGPDPGGHGINWEQFDQHREDWEQQSPSLL